MYRQYNAYTLQLRRYAHNHMNLFNKELKLNTLKKNRIASRNDLHERGLGLVGEESHTHLLPFLRKMKRCDGNVEKVFEILNRVRATRWQPSLVLYTAAIRQCTRKLNMKEAEDIFETLLEENIEPDVVVFNTLISGFSKLRDIENCQKLFDELKRRGLEADLVT